MNQDIRADYRPGKPLAIMTKEGWVNLTWSAEPAIVKPAPNPFAGASSRYKGLFTDSGKNEDIRDLPIVKHRYTGAMHFDWTFWPPRESEFKEHPYLAMVDDFTP